MIFKKKVCILLIVFGLLPYVASFSSNKLMDSYSLSKKILDSDKNLLRLTLASDDQYRLAAEYKEFPEEVKTAFLLKEDKYFFYHIGFNPFSIMRALVQTLFLKKSRSGASTITMQLARLHYELRTKTIIGKIKQIALAYWLEVLYDKKEIFTAYLNLTPYGRNIIGFETAARVYFQKPLERLMLPEILALVSIPQSPGLLNKHMEFSRAPKRIESKMKELFSRWRDAKVKNENTHITGLDLYFYGLKDIPFKAPHFTDYVLSQQTKLRSFSTTLSSEKQEIIEKNRGRQPQDIYFYEKHIFY